MVSWLVLVPIHRFSLIKQLHSVTFVCLYSLFRSWVFDNIFTYNVIIEYRIKTFLIVRVTLFSMFSVFYHLLNLKMQQTQQSLNSQSPFNWLRAHFGTTSTKNCISSTQMGKLFIDQILLQRKNKSFAQVYYFDKLIL